MKFYITENDYLKLKMMWYAGILSKSMLRFAKSIVKEVKQLPEKCEKNY